MTATLQQHPPASAARVAGFRLLSMGKLAAQAGVELADKIGVYTDRFLAQAIRAPYRCEKVNGLTFVIIGPEESSEFNAYVAKVHRNLQEFLFGEEVSGKIEVLSFAGHCEDVVVFLDEDPTAAVARSDAFHDQVRTQEQGPRDVSYDWRAQRKKLGADAFAYRGIYECKHLILLSYMVTARKAPEASLDMRLGQYLRLQGSDAIHFEIDAYKKAVEYVSLFQSNKMPIVMGVGVTLGTLLSPRARETYMRALQPQPALAAGLVSCIVGGPDAPPRSTAAQIMAQLSPHFKFIDWQTSNPALDVASFVDKAMHSVTLDLEETGARRAQALERFIGRVGELRALGLRAGLAGVDTREELDAGLDAGVVYVSGRAVTEPLAAPRSPARRAPTALPES